MPFLAFLGVLHTPSKRRKPGVFLKSEAQIVLHYIGITHGKFIDSEKLSQLCKRIVRKCSRAAKSNWHKLPSVSQNITARVTTCRLPAHWSLSRESTKENQHKRRIIVGLWESTSRGLSSQQSLVIWRLSEAARAFTIILLRPDRLISLETISKTSAWNGTFSSHRAAAESFRRPFKEAHVSTLSRLMRHLS